MRESLLPILQLLYKGSFLLCLEIKLASGDLAVCLTMSSLVGNAGVISKAPRPLQGKARLAVLAADHRAL